MAAQVQGYPRCPCGSIQGSSNQSGCEANGFEGIYFIVGQQQSPPRRLVETSAPLASPPVASSRTSVPPSSPNAGPPPPPPMIPGPPPPPILPSFPEDVDDDAPFNLGDAIKGFFASGGKLKPASERKLGPKRKPPRRVTTTTPTRQTGTNSSNGSSSSSTPVHSTIQASSEAEVSDASASTVDEGVDHVELINNALRTMRPDIQDSDDEDSDGEHNEWNED